MNAFDLNAQTIQKLERGRSARSKAQKLKMFQDCKKKAEQARNDFVSIITGHHLNNLSAVDNIKAARVKMDEALEANQKVHKHVKQVLAAYETARKNEEMLYRKHHVYVRELSKLESNVVMLKSRLSQDKNKLKTWKKEHRDKIKEHRRTLKQCEKEEKKCQHEIKSIHIMNKVELDAAKAKETLVRKRRDSAKSLVSRDEAELNAFESKVNVDEAELKLELSHIKEAQNLVKTYKKKFADAERESKAVKTELLSSIENWKGSCLASSFALSSWGKQSEQLHGDDSLNQQNMWSAKCVEAADRELLCCKEFCSCAPDYGSRIHAEDMLQGARFHCELVHDIKKSIKSLRFSSIRKSKIIEESMKDRIRVNENRDKERVICLQTLNALENMYQAKREEDMGIEEEEAALKELKATKNDSKSHALAMENLKKAREHQHLAHGHVEKASQKLRISKQEETSAEKKEQESLQSLEIKRKQEIALDDAMFQELKRNPMLEEHHSDDWLKKLELDHHVHMHTRSEIATLVKKHDMDMMLAEQTKAHPVYECEHGHGDHLSDIDIDSDDNENHDKRHHTPGQVRNKAHNVHASLDTHVVHGHHLNMFQSFDQDSHFVSTLEHDQHEELDAEHAIHRHHPSPSASRTIGRYNSHEKLSHGEKNDVPVVVKMSGGGGCCVVT